MPTSQQQQQNKKRKRKRNIKPWCYFCDRSFDDEKVLINHQKAKHFKCPTCNKKFGSGSGMVTHVLQVHKSNLETVPNAVPGRDTFQYDVVGMERIPIELQLEKEGYTAEEIREYKRQRTDENEPLDEASNPATTETAEDTSAPAGQIPSATPIVTSSPFIPHVAAAPVAAQTMYSAPFYPSMPAQAFGMYPPMQTGFPAPAPAFGVPAPVPALAPAPATTFSRMPPPPAPKSSFLPPPPPPVAVIPSDAKKPAMSPSSTKNAAFDSNTLKTASKELEKPLPPSPVKPKDESKTAEEKIPTPTSSPLKQETETEKDKETDKNIPVEKNLIFVYNGTVSMEERRAMLPKYAIGTGKKA